MKYILTGLAVLGIVLLPSFAKAEFDVSLGYGASGDAVLELQQFLFDQELLTVEPSGNYLGRTWEAVIAFQRVNGIEQTGYFGELSRAAARSLLTQSQAPKATIHNAGIYSSPGGAAVFSSGLKTITWQTSTYPTNTGVNINLLRKLSSEPTRYELVRQVAADSPNDGNESWKPLSGENTNDLYLEITCSTTRQFTSGCQTSALVKVSGI